jgi:SAM-dependent methyltransferase
VSTGVDPQTLTAYDADASAFAQDWHAQPPPSDLHAIIKRFFKPGLTADVGCGSGRDTAWLSATGFPTVGYDASQGLLAEARKRYPKLEFHCAALPDLSGVADESFDNVLCETVVMHLDRTAIAPAVQRVLTILKPGGTLYVSWRVSQTDQRDRHGRLYAAFDKALVSGALTGQSILLDEEVVSASSGKIIHRVVARKNGAAT